MAGHRHCNTLTTTAKREETMETSEVPEAVSAIRLHPAMASARAYLVAHRIPQLLSDLTAAACFRQPISLAKFLVAELERRRKLVRIFHI
ncbi:hypothetical protein Esti_002399 [Eimeria stiedai]